MAVPVCLTLALPVDCLGYFGPRGLSVQYTQEIRGCPSAHTRRPWLYVCVCVCPSAHTGRPWLSVCVRKHTQDVRGCPSVHISAQWSLDSGRWPFPWTVWVILAHVGSLFSKHRTSVGVWVCPSSYIGRRWLSISAHISTLVLGLSTLALPVDCSGDFGPRGLSVQYTQDVCGCPTHISTLVLGLSTLTLPVDCLGDSGPRGLSVKYTQDVCGCPSAHTGRSCVSVSTHRTFVAVCGCSSAQTGRLWVSVSTHKTYVAVRMCLSAHLGRLWLSISTHICMLVLGLSTLTLHVDCSGDFGPRGLSVQYTQDVCGCPPAHTGRLWLSVCVRVCPCVSVSTHRTSVPVHQYTYQQVGPSTQHAGPSSGLFRTSVAVCGCPSAHIGRLWLSVALRVCPCVSVSTHRTSVVVHQLSVQYTQNVRGCPSAHTGRLCVSFSTHRTSMAVRVCPSAHTGRPWLSIKTHIITLVLGLSTLTLPVDCSGDFCLRGLSVQYTQDVRGCPLVHTGHPWLYMCVCACPSAHTGRLWLSIDTHISTLVLGLSTLAHPVDCLGDFGPRGQSVQYTQDVRGCPPAHTGRLWLSVAVRQHTQDIPHTVRLWQSISTHISTLVLGLSTLALPVDCLGDFGPRGLSVQYTQYVCGCPPAHTGRPWLSVAVR
ncbi:hypothetical protein YC2023_066256 [Brassica napus]